MNRRNDNLLDDKLQAIFNKRELNTEALVVILNSARKNSIKKDRIERKTVVEKVNIDNINKSILGVALSVLLVVNTLPIVNSIVSGVETFATSVSDNIQNLQGLSMFNLSREIGALVNDGEKMSIVSQNTHRNGDTSYYNQENIAKDLLKLDSHLFDYAFCAVCKDMGININNKVGYAGMSNIDSVIYYLKLYSSNQGNLSSDYVSEAFTGVDSLEDYLIKFGYLDKEGGASLEEFEKACDEKAQVISDLINSGIGIGGVKKA